ncbi:uncharacterized protein K460DRAFT_368123 [Cucurbitaria berberidis CBS 394.84]|uniref:Uncharacterized protein n=1 Tax=Cucurbitaria berberidis CBS 394.84 TaxID=1168544 RepID=A0A9P4GCP4_9PLEO|nr:uncharacterized protein K460DRAFT_368123 [Cucurbitaria berberidis CBS 394.84]KAF1843212.1 hypothetical protein K460DRAFT_368123 [Cucurbitaria berberidis CBS 394.84]
MLETCRAIQTLLHPSTTNTLVATISNSKNLPYTILTHPYDDGLHHAPVPQPAHFLSGVAHVTSPQDEKVDLWILGEKAGLLFAVDTVGIGHATHYPSDLETIAIVAPFVEGSFAEHDVVASEGPCSAM